MPTEEPINLTVASVCCDKCREKDFKLYRCLGPTKEDTLNYFLVCKKCGKAKGFRIFLVWDADVKTRMLPKGESDFLRELENLQ